MSSANSPCAACKCLRRKCTPECIFAPYFPPDNPEKFACVRKVFGASNISKILNEVSPVDREEAVISLAYEARTRLQNPVYGCLALISYLQQRVKQVNEEIRRAKRELSQYMQPNAGEYPFAPYNNFMPHDGQLVMHELHPQQMLEAQEMTRIGFKQHQHQLNNNQMMNNGVVVSELGLNNFENGNNCHISEEYRDMQLQKHEQLLIQRQKSKSEEGPSIGPSC